MDAIEAPPGDWGGPKAAFAEVLAHEQTVTGMINDLLDLAISEKGHATAAFLQWFKTEQGEDKNACSSLAQIEALGDVIGHLFWLDHHLGKRA